VSMAVTLTASLHCQGKRECSIKYAYTYNYATFATHNPRNHGKRGMDCLAVMFLGGSARMLDGFILRICLITVKAVASKYK